MLLAICFKCMKFPFQFFLVWARFWSLIYWISFWFPALSNIYTERAKPEHKIWYGLPQNDGNNEIVTRKKKMWKKKRTQWTLFLRVHLLINDERKMKFSLLYEGLHLYLLRALCFHAFEFFLFVCLLLAFAQLWIIVVMMVRPWVTDLFLNYNQHFFLLISLLWISFYMCSFYSRNAYYKSNIWLVTLSWCRKP